MITLGIDAHKRTHTVVAVDDLGREARPELGPDAPLAHALPPHRRRQLSPRQPGRPRRPHRPRRRPPRPPSHGRRARAPAEVGGRVAELAPNLLGLPGVCPLTAAKIVGEVADIRRFKSKDAFARHNGSALLPVWSGNQERHRLSRTGNRQLNAAIHRIAISQGRCHEDAASRGIRTPRLSQNPA
jgi:transposase